MELNFSYINWLELLKLLHSNIKSEELGEGIGDVCQKSSQTLGELLKTVHKQQIGIIFTPKKSYTVGTECRKYYAFRKLEVLMGWYNNNKLYCMANFDYFCQ